MAIRDRLTIVTKEGSCGLVVTKQGGSIELFEPTKNVPWLRANVVDKNGNQTNESVTVAAESIVYFSRDSEPKSKLAKRS